MRFTFVLEPFLEALREQTIFGSYEIAVMHQDVEVTTGLAQCNIAIRCCGEQRALVRHSANFAAFKEVDDFAKFLNKGQVTLPVRIVEALEVGQNGIGDTILAKVPEIIVHK